MWKKVIALNLAIILGFLLLPMDNITVFSSSGGTGYAVFYKNDGSNSSTNSMCPHLSSNGGLSLYVMMPNYTAENKRVVSFNSDPNGSGKEYSLTSCIYNIYSYSTAAATKLYAMWEPAEDNSILYLSASGTTNGGKDYYLQSGLSQTATLAGESTFTESDGRKIIGWRSLDSYKTYLPGDVIEMSSNMTMVSIPGVNYFRLHYKSYYDDNKVNTFTLTHESEHLWYSQNLKDYEYDIRGKFFVGWNSKADGSGEWIVDLNENTPHELYAQYEPYPENDSWVKICSSKGLQSKKKYEILHLDESGKVTFPSVVSNGTKVGFWKSNSQTYPAGEKVEIKHLKNSFSAVTTNDGNLVGVIYGNGGVATPSTEYIGINYYTTSTGGMSLYNFNDLQLFNKDNHVFIGYKGNKTGTIYDYYDDIKSALLNEKDGDTSKFTAQYEPVENGYIQYFGNGGRTPDKKGQYYEEIDFSNITTETFAKNKFIHPDGKNFLGWQSANNQSIIYKQGAKIELDENTPLYAFWGNNAVIAHKTDSFGEKYTEIHKDVKSIKDVPHLNSNYVSMGYFKGWNTKSDGSGDWYSCNDAIPDGAVLELYEQWAHPPANGYYYIICNVKQEDGSQLKFVPMNSQTQTITIPKNDTYKYWYNTNNVDKIDFYGFADQSEYIYSSGDSIQISSGDVIAPFSVWHMTTYHENYGDSGRTRVHYNMSSFGSLRVCSPGQIFPDIPYTRPFLGWNSSADGSGMDFEVGEYASNITLYAQWLTKDSVVTGSCGSNISWKFKGDGTLTISGTGVMYDNSSWDDHAFWNSLKPYIKNIIINEGITCIGRYAFDDCSNLESVAIPKSVTLIRQRAFSNCTSLSTINYSGTSADWDDITIENRNEPLLTINPTVVVPKTKTTISNNGKTFTVTPNNIRRGKTVLLALYDGEKFVEMQSATYNGSVINFTTSKTYTNAKVMVWDNLSNLKPLYDVEIVK